MKLVREYIEMMLEQNGARLEPTEENIEIARQFLMDKWRERAAEYGRANPEDLSGACKFASTFAQRVFGGEIRSNWHHSHVKLGSGQVIDLTAGSADVAALADPYYHDRSFARGREFKDSLKSCSMRSAKWADEFLAMHHGDAEERLIEMMLDEGKEDIEILYVDEDGTAEWEEPYLDNPGYVPVDQQVDDLRKRVPLGISYTKDLSYVAFDTTEGKVLGALYDAYHHSSENYDFDTLVDPDARRQGIASRLIDAAIDKFENEIRDVFSDATMEVHVVNRNIIGLLVDKGFEDPDAEDWQFDPEENNGRTQGVLMRYEG